MTSISLTWQEMKTMLDNDLAYFLSPYEQATPYLASSPNFEYDACVKKVWDILDEYGMTGLSEEDDGMTYVTVINNPF